MDIGVSGTARPERRAAPRVATPHAAASLKAWLRSGAEIALINLSAAGALIESGRRLMPGARVDLQVHTRTGRFVLTGRLVRAEVSALRSDAVRYRAGMAFEGASVGSAASLTRMVQGSSYPAGRASVAPGKAGGLDGPRPRRPAADGTLFGSARSLSRVLR